MLTKGAIGNLVNRYRAVLTKCNLINTFGSLAVASMLVLGGAGVAGAVTTLTPETGGGMTNAALESYALNKEKEFNLSFADDTISLVTMKKADGKNATIFRLLNNSNDCVKTSISVNSLSLKLDFGKYEVKTVVLKNGELREEKMLII